MHFTQTLSLVADVNPYGLIFKVFHVLNLCIYYRTDIWAILSDVQHHHKSTVVSVHGDQSNIDSISWMNVLSHYTSAMAVKPTEL